VPNGQAKGMAWPKRMAFKRLGLLLGGRWVLALGRGIKAAHSEKAE
jgi:hypothetical protein